MQWYYAIDGQRFGPVPHSELERLVKAGTVLADTLVWRQGMNEWLSLAQVRETNPAWFADERPAGGGFEVEGMRATRSEADPAGAVGAVNVVAEAAAAPVYAGFWRRFGAHVVDFFLWWVIWQVLAGVVGTLYFPEAMEIAQTIEAHGPGYQMSPAEMVVLMRFVAAAFGVGLLWAILYDASFMLRFAATPGKLVFGIRVVDADGSRLGFGRIVLRCVAKGLAGLTLGIGYLIVAFDEQKRGLHDFISGTRVIKKL